MTTRTVQDAPLAVVTTPAEESVKPGIYRIAVKWLSTLFVRNGNEQAQDWFRMKRRYSERKQQQMSDPAAPQIEDKLRIGMYHALN